MWFRLLSLIVVCVFRWLAVLVCRKSGRPRADLEGALPSNHLTDAEVYAMIDSLGEVGMAVADATRRA